MLMIKYQIKKMNIDYFLGQMTVLTDVFIIGSMFYRLIAV